MNNEWHEWHESTKQDNERKRSANETNAADMNMPHGFAKFAFYVIFRNYSAVVMACQIFKPQTRLEQRYMEYFRVSWRSQRRNEARGMRPPRT
ncbi:MAG: hypothetical protein SPJ90_05540, partial [Prevotella sp.]|nr:hypothetical protein [Prevotellaceae bacterium]MDY5843876.1 hypothetical protein [Prevotella sp.]